MFSIAWGEWGSAIGNYYSNKYGSPDDVPGLPQYKKRETWGEWGSAIGQHYANEYGSPDDVPGLPHYKRSSAKRSSTKRSIDSADAIAQIRLLQIDLQQVMLSLGRSDSTMSAISQLENLVAQAVQPNADLPSILSQAQDVVNSATA